MHYVVKHVIEGMSATCDAKSGNVELADICKKILPIAGKKCLLFIVAFIMPRAKEAHVWFQSPKCALICTAFFVFLGSFPIIPTPRHIPGRPCSLTALARGNPPKRCFALSVAASGGRGHRQDRHEGDVGLFQHENAGPDEQSTRRQQLGAGKGTENMLVFVVIVACDVHLY